MREFETGATRDDDSGKYDYEGFINPLVLGRFAEYMYGHRVQADGKIRESDNWQKGMPTEAYMKSLLRHVMALWKVHRDYYDPAEIEDSLCAIVFNAFGYLYNLLHEDDPGLNVVPTTPDLDDARTVVNNLMFDRGCNGNCNC